MFSEKKYERAMNWLKKQDNGHSEVRKKSNSDDNEELNNEDSKDKYEDDFDGIAEFDEDIKVGFKDYVALVLSAFLMILPVVIIVLAIILFLGSILFI